MKQFKLTLLASSLFIPMAGHALSFGALSNFDAVNDTGSVAHGFEIELDDISARDVTYTFQWQRYGKPVIVEDHTDPQHPNKVFVRWLSPYDQANHVFTKTTQVAAAGFKNTGGHACFGNGNINGTTYDLSGCEHFGVGVLKNPSNTVYTWLKEDPANPGTLQGNAPPPPAANPNPSKPPPVSIPQPVWNVQPPAAAGQPVVVKAVIPVPPIPASSVPVPVAPAGVEFGNAAWAKVLETESADPELLSDLVSDSPKVPGNATGINPPNTITEFEWQILQTDSKNPTANELAIEKPMGAGNENVTRRYEFYKYTGPYDVMDADGLPGTNEAFCTSVAADGIHGNPKPYSTFVPGPSGSPVPHDGDCGNEVVVGDYIGAQMAGADVAMQLSANDADMPVAEVGVPYPDRPLLFGGSGVYDIQFTSGTLPNGAPAFGLDTAGMLSGGTPQAPGTATFTVKADDLANAKTLNATFNLQVVDRVKTDNVQIPNGMVNGKTQALLTASNGVSPFHWSVAPASSGLTASILGANTLMLQASTPGVKQVQATVTDSLGGTDVKTFSYVVPGAASTDHDQDGMLDSSDNCSQVYNPDQRDTDGDGYGNICDPDLNGNLLVNLADLALFRSRLNSADANADFNGDGIVDQADLAILKAYYNKAPGPSGLHP